MKLVSKIISGILIFVLSFVAFSSIFPEIKGQLNLILIGNLYSFVEKIGAFFPKLILIFIVLLIARSIIYLVKTSLKKYSEIIEGNVKESKAMPIVRFVVWLMAFISVLSILFDDIGALLTSIGLMGVGLTFALQRPILNFVGWVTIIMNGTYTVGDRISINDVKGDVKEIDIMYTILDGLLEKTDELSGKTITVPNEIVLTSPVTNYTKTGEYIWDELEVSITYESNWKKGIQKLEEIAYEVTNKYIKHSEGIISHKEGAMQGILKNFKMTKKQPKNLKSKNDRTIHDEERIEEHRENRPIVRVMFQDSAVALNVRYLAFYQKKMAIKSEINSKFLKITEKNKNLEIAYPHLQIIRRK